MTESPASGSVALTTGESGPVSVSWTDMMVAGPSSSNMGGSCLSMTVMVTIAFTLDSCFLSPALPVATTVTHSGFFRFMVESGRLGHQLSGGPSNGEKGFIRFIIAHPRTHK